MKIKVLIMRFIGTISPLLISKILYKKTFGKALNLKNPITLNEKIQWLKFYGDTSLWPMLADKYEVREFVKAKGLENTLVKLYGKWNDANDIDWEKLPNKFVLKANNGCGDVTICKDKLKLNKRQLVDYYNGLMKDKFGVQTGQLHYKLIKPCIIAEELLDISKQSTPSSSLIDYKIWCFDGKASYIFVILNRTKEHADFMIFDLDWNQHPEYLVETNHFDVYKGVIQKPMFLNEMLRISETLSKGYPQMRVDLYEVDGKIYFGELTLTSAGGLMNYFTDEFLRLTGSMVKLPNCNK